MRIRAGLTTSSPAWRQLLRQEGIPSDVVSPDSMDPSEWSLIVVSGELTGEARIALEGYLAGGGAVIGYSGHLEGVSGIRVRNAWIEYLHAVHDKRFPDLSIIDLGVDGLVPREANALRTQENEFSLFAGGWGGGFLVALPFDPAVVLFDERRADRSFFHTTGRLPSERVSLVGKGEVRQLLHRCLEFLHHARGLPYVHLWYYPSAASAVSSFRVDTDGASRREVDTLYHLAHDHGIPVSWYIDVKSHEEWLGHFSAFDGQEIGIHCYEHRTDEEYGLNETNFGKAKELLRKAGLMPKGFAAPFGIWNRSLGRLLDEMEMEYSSEFSYAYDTLPLYPRTNGDQFKTLQVPIHPICPGSMLRVGYTEERMIEYFGRVIEWKLSRGEPLIFYHHPSHGSPAVIRFLFESALRKDILPMTMLDFSRWWKVRESVDVGFEFDSERAEVEVRSPASSPSDVAVETTTGLGRFRRTMLSEKRVSLKGSEKWERIRRLILPEDVLRIREFDPRASFGGLYNTIMRKLK